MGLVRSALLMRCDTASDKQLTDLILASDLHNLNSIEVPSSGPDEVTRI